MEAAPCDLSLLGHAFVGYMPTDGKARESMLAGIVRRRARDSADATRVAEEIAATLDLVVPAGVAVGLVVPHSWALGKIANSVPRSTGSQASKAG